MSLTKQTLEEQGFFDQNHDCHFSEEDGCPVCDEMQTRADEERRLLEAKQAIYDQ